ncbi:MAG TPA: MarR family transcriptional regulator [Bradyrhizobium sp.]|uniref:MarR family winged helix-turn-helix transcriptional regulator n=1 Tax=Bradyrhizobium sp. TaxID=376 RepID=UPI002CB83A93|nr:MarR family transcriptional regulator [Bradyrhizobium sp.]HLZ06450.1 MarR family transcriptional regulator [Bradyrhizobium sp.]
MSRTKARAVLLQELENAMRKASAQGTMFAKAVADRAGISSSDMDCMDFLNMEGRMTAGRLAELTGLTTGAITGVVDRLEKAGFVRRERDESDRRKVFIAPVPERMMEIGRFYALMQRAMQKQAERYTDSELKLLLRYAAECNQSILEATTALKTVMEAEPKEKGSRAAKPRAAK